MRVSATSTPFSPVMIVMRSLNGVSQLTMCEVIVPPRERADRDDHVFVRATAAVRGAGVDRDVLLLRDPRGEVDVVGGEVFDDADVGDATGERTLAAGGDLVDLAEQAVFDALARRLQRRVVALDVADAADRGPSLAKRSRSVARVFGGRGDGLLDERVDAAPRRGACPCSRW